MNFSHQVLLNGTSHIQCKRCVFLCRFGKLGQENSGWRELRVPELQTQPKQHFLSVHKLFLARCLIFSDIVELGSFSLTGSWQRLRTLHILEFVHHRRDVFWHSCLTYIHRVHISGYVCGYKNNNYQGWRASPSQRVQLYLYILCLLGPSSCD